MDYNNVAFYHAMGLGKTFTGSARMIAYGKRVNLVICQKSKLKDWQDHFLNNYPSVRVYRLDKPKEYTAFFDSIKQRGRTVGIINYDIIHRRKELYHIQNFTLMLDESSVIQNENTLRCKAVMRLRSPHIILLSGTPVGGKYENLWSQMRLLGWGITKKMFWSHFVDYHYDTRQGFPLLIVDGYKNVDRLKRKMREYGAQFLKTEEVFDLPPQVDQRVVVDVTSDYNNYLKHGVLEIGDETLVNDNPLVNMLNARKLCGMYNNDKLGAFYDLVQSTSDRLIVFYNFTHELELLEATVGDRPVSIVNGETKDLSAYEDCDDSITFIQYQAGAMGLNLQKANRVVYFTPTLSSELFEQSKKRIHRIGQDRTCFYYYMICKDSVEEKIYKTLEMRNDFTQELFIEYIEKEGGRVDTGDNVR